MQFSDLQEGTLTPRLKASADLHEDRRGRALASWDMGLRLTEGIRVSSAGCAYVATLLVAMDAPLRLPGPEGAEEQ